MKKTDRDSAASLTLRARPLTKAGFAPFGDVIEAAGVKPQRINDGWALRYDDVARIDVAARGGRPIVNLFRAKPRALPLRIAVLERHPLSSQAFIPLSEGSLLVIVAPPGRVPDPKDIRCFRTKPGQGINFAPGTWHHPLTVLDRRLDVLVIDRGGRGQNCDEIYFQDREILCLG